MPLVDLDDPEELRARWSALAAVAHATGYDRRWYADEHGWYHQDETGSDLRMVRLDGGRAVLFGFHTQHTQTAEADLLAGAPDWIGQPEVKRRIAGGDLGFVYGSFNGTWARASYPGDPWQPLDDGFLPIGEWITSDEEAAREMIEWAAEWADYLGGLDELLPIGVRLIRTAATTGITPESLLDLFDRLGIGPQSPQHPDLRAALAAASAFNGNAVSQPAPATPRGPAPAAQSRPSAAAPPPASTPAPAAPEAPYPGGYSGSPAGYSEPGAQPDAYAAAEALADEADDEESVVVPPGISPFTGQPIGDDADLLIGGGEPFTPEPPFASEPPFTPEPPLNPEPPFRPDSPFAPEPPYQPEPPFTPEPDPDPPYQPEDAADEYGVVAKKPRLFRRRKHEDPAPPASTSPAPATGTPHAPPAGTPYTPPAGAPYAPAAGTPYDPSAGESYPSPVPYTSPTDGPRTPAPGAQYGRSTGEQPGQADAGAPRLPSSEPRVGGPVDDGEDFYASLFADAPAAATYVPDVVRDTPADPNAWSADDATNEIAAITDDTGEVAPIPAVSASDDTGVIPPIPTEEDPSTPPQNPFAPPQNPFAAPPAPSAAPQASSIPSADPSAPPPDPFALRADQAPQRSDPSAPHSDHSAPHSDPFAAAPATDAWPASGAEQGPGAWAAPDAEPAAEAQLDASAGRLGNTGQATDAGLATDSESASGAWAAPQAESATDARLGGDVGRLGNTGRVADAGQVTDAGLAAGARSDAPEGDFGAHQYGRRADGAGGGAEGSGPFGVDPGGHAGAGGFEFRHDAFGDGREPGAGGALDADRGLFEENAEYEGVAEARPQAQLERERQAQLEPEPHTQRERERHTQQEREPETRRERDRQARPEPQAQRELEPEPQVQLELEPEPQVQLEQQQPEAEYVPEPPVEPAKPEWIGGAWINGVWVEDVAAYLAAQHAAGPAKAGSVDAVPTEEFSQLPPVDEPPTEEHVLGLTNLEQGPQAPPTEESSTQQSSAEEPSNEQFSNEQLSNEQRSNEQLWPEQLSNEELPTEEPPTEEQFLDLARFGQDGDPAAEERLEGLNPFERSGEQPSAEKHLQTGDQFEQPVDDAQDHDLSRFPGRLEDVQEPVTEERLQAFNRFEQPAERVFGHGRLEQDADGAVADRAAEQVQPDTEEPPVEEQLAEVDGQVVDEPPTEERVFGFSAGEFGGAPVEDQLIGVPAESDLSAEVPAAEASRNEESAGEPQAEVEGDAPTAEIAAVVDQDPEDEYYAAGSSPFAPEAREAREARDIPPNGFSSLEPLGDFDYRLGDEGFHDEILGDADWTADQLGEPQQQPQELQHPQEPEQPREPQEPAATEVTAQFEPIREDDEPQTSEQAPEDVPEEAAELTADAAAQVEPQERPEKLVVPDEGGAPVAIPGLGVVGGDSPRVETPPGSIEEAMRAEIERPRPRPKESAAFHALREWCRARTKVVPSGFTIQVQVLDPAAPSYRFDLEPPEVDDPQYGAEMLTELLGDLWIAESQGEQGGWLFARMDAAGRTLRIDRWYDSVPDWWDNPVESRLDVDGLVRRLNGRGADWQPSYLEKLYTSAG